MTSQRHLLNAHSPVKSQCSSQGQTDYMLSNLGRVFQHLTSTKQKMMVCLKRHILPLTSTKLLVHLLNHLTVRGSKQTSINRLSRSRIQKSFSKMKSWSLTKIQDQVSMIQVIHTKQVEFQQNFSEIALPKASTHLVNLQKLLNQFDILNHNHCLKSKCLRRNLNPVQVHT